jgi:phosphate transport system substrate-binding protein
MIIFKTDSKMTTKNFINLILGTALVLTTSCSGGQKGATDLKSLSGTVKVDGSSTVYPITEAIAEEFLNEAPAVRVTVGVSGTGGGFKKFGRGEIDINDASRPIKDKEIEACKESGIEYIQLTIAYDGLAVIVHPSNNWVDHLTVEELKKIWEPQAEGVIMRWSDIRSGWPNEKISLYGPDAASGTYDYFTEVIVGESGKSRGDYTNSSDDNVLVQGVVSDKYSLGFFGLAYYEENMDKLKLVGVDGGKGVVIPSLESVSDNTYTPLSRPVYIYVTKASVSRPEVKRFVEFYLEEAPKIAKDVGYVPLPAELYEREKKNFQLFVK